MSVEVEQIVSKLEKVNRANKELISCLIDDFCCLDAFPHRALKKQVYKYAIAYFEGKYIESKGNMKKVPNDRCSILLQIAIEDWQAAKGDAERIAVAKMARTIFDSSIQELRVVPDDIRVTAFKIVRSFLTEMSQ